jgi:hypothetical protein
MSLRSSIRKKPQVSLGGSRLYDAQDRVSQSARRAARQMGPTSRQARELAAERMMSARGWSAPRIDQAGQYIEHEIGPRVSELLHRTADRVEPKRRQRRRRRGIAAMLLLVGGAMGAAGAIATRRNTRSAQEATPSSPADRLSSVSKDTSTEDAHTS